MSTNAEKYEAVIGLEVHTQLKTKSKIFCSCSADFGGSPNDHVCPLCLGLPGVLPVLNKRVVEYSIKAGLALNCEIASVTKFDRKNYFYPDLPKGYQISQYDQPICRSGHLNIDGNKVRIHRAHMEEDTGKLVHAGASGLHGSSYSLVDFNRCGVPLLEIVSEPDMRSADEARQYLVELRNILRCIGISDGNMEEGSFRCDANVSIRKVGDTELGTKAEIKNMNSFKAVHRAVQSEIDRQTEVLESGKRVAQETRLWDEGSQKTYPMRSKEEAHDYRYFPEPDLVPLTIDRSWVDSIKATLPELPESRRKRYTTECKLSADDAFLIAESMELSNLFDAVVKLGASPRAAANLLLGPTLGYLNEHKLELSTTPLTSQHISDLINAQASGTLNSTTAKQVLNEVLKNGGSVKEVIESKGLAQISDEADLRKIVEEVLRNNTSQVEEFRAGKVKMRQFFVGETMKATRGKANPQVIDRLLDELLK
jgi:aspartyl-tRNA(Asn)/glutamyl-tRNA(Gln) amidotransferase subunit B